MSEQQRNDFEHDKRLAALYRAAGEESPPPALDDAIRAASRRAVASRPTPARAPFGHSWRVPLSVAAVVVLSVSLVTVMREQAPEVVQVPGAQVPPQTVVSEKSAATSAARETRSPEPEARQSSGLGLKPPASPAIGLRRDESAAPAAAPHKQAHAERSRQEVVPAAPSLKRPSSPQAFPAAPAARGNLAAESARGAAGDATRREAAVASSATTESERPAREQVGAPPRYATPPAAGEAAATADAAKASVPAQPPAEPRQRTLAATAKSPAAASEAAASAEARTAAAMSAPANLPPAKWLAQIEELHRQGRTVEARTSLAEFRKRHPDYPLPPALKEIMQP